MSFTSQFIEDSLRVGEQQELEDGNAQLFADLRTHLDDRVITNGVSIELGDDRAALNSIIGLLGIPRTLWSLNGQLHVHNVVVQSGATTSFIGDSITSIANLSIIDALSALQADHWRWDTPHGPYPKIRVVHDSAITSKLVLGKPIVKGQEKRTDAKALGMVIGVTNRYLPVFNPTTIKADLNYFFRDVDDGSKFPRDVVGPLATEMMVRDLSLNMPSTSYFIRFGALRGANISPIMNAIEDVVTSHALQLQSGRIEKIC